MHSPEDSVVCVSRLGLKVYSTQKEIESANIYQIDCSPNIFLINFLKKIETVCFGYCFNISRLILCVSHMVCLLFTKHRIKFLFEFFPNYTKLATFALNTSVGKIKKSS